MRHFDTYTKQIRKSKRIPRTIYQMNIPRKFINELTPSDINWLRKMNKELFKSRQNLPPNSFDSITELEDWIAEYRQEGHIL